MPAENTRLRRPVTGRDRRFLALAAGALPATVTAAFLLTPPPNHHPGCATTTRAGFLGGATVTYCGARAIKLCRTLAAEDTPLGNHCDALAARSQP